MTKQGSKAKPLSPPSPLCAAVMQCGYGMPLPFLLRCFFLVFLVCSTGMNGEQHGDSKTLFSSSSGRRLPLIPPLSHAHTSTVPQAYLSLSLLRSPNPTHSPSAGRSFSSLTLRVC
eukprot:RCo015498